MGFSAYSRVEVELRPGTTIDQVTAACRPLLDWRIGEILPNDNDLHETGIAFDEEDGVLTLQITCDCPYGFGPDTFGPVMHAIGELALDPFEAVLVNESTANEDDREFVVLAGPAEQLPEFASQLATASIQDALPSVIPPAGSTGVSIEEAAAAETLAISFPDIEGKIDQRILLQLGDLGLTDRQRMEATRLTVLLARVLGRDAPIKVDGFSPDAHAETSAPRG
jgi:hypothetical protein